MEFFKTTKTELHTHFTGILSVESFLILFKSFNSPIFVDDNDNIVKYSEATKSLTVDEIFNNPYLFKKIVEQISILPGNQIKYTDMNPIYAKRTFLLGQLVETHAQRYPEFPKSEIKEIVYNIYFSCALDELEKQGLQNVQISFSNGDIIEALEVPSKHKDMDIKFLLSMDRTRSPKGTLKNIEKYFEKSPNSNLRIGIDIMGMEDSISELELEIQMLERLKGAINLLTDTPDSVLRIHSGETPQSKHNTKKILKLIDSLQATYGYSIPDPEIRIGHGTHVEIDNEYIELLKKFGCSIEINATSNYALGNIKNMGQLKYREYLENNIPIYICTDGSGVYNTTILNEDKIARSRLTEAEYSQILETDRLRRKK